MPVSTLKGQCAISRDNVDTFHRLQTLPPSRARAWKRVPVQTPSALFPKCSSKTGQKGPASQVEIVKKRQWVSPAPSKNRKPPPAWNLGQRRTHLANVKGGRQRGGMQRPRSEGLSAENPLGLRHPPFCFQRWVQKGKQQGLPFVSRGKALRRGLTAGSWTALGVAMTNLAQPQMPPAGWAPVRKGPQDWIFAAAGGDGRAWRGAATCTGPEAGAHGQGWDNGA